MQDTIRQKSKHMKNDKDEGEDKRNVRHGKGRMFISVSQLVDFYSSFFRRNLRSSLRRSRSSLRCCLESCRAVSVLEAAVSPDGGGGTASGPAMAKNALRNDH